MEIAVHLLFLALCLFFAAPAACSWDPNCIKEPVGFGSRATGGAGGRTVKPKTIRGLKKFLNSREKLIIDLTRTFDLTGSEGYATSRGCYFQKCGNGFQESLAHAGTCSGRKPTSVKYSKAGLHGMLVSSDKSIISSNGKGGLKGKGLIIKNAKNVIIRDISISDINPEVIWAGDALVFSKATDVWVHNVRFSNIGRQHLVTDEVPDNRITVSSCLFDGKTPNAAYCDGKHYWVMLFWGTSDKITLINNLFRDTAGRLPHAGGWKKANNMVHLIGNVMENNPHAGIEARKGSKILVEGNKFRRMSSPWNTRAKGGLLAMIDSPADAHMCFEELGRRCLKNIYISSKQRNRVDKGVFRAFKSEERAVISARKAAAACLA